MHERGTPIKTAIPAADPAASAAPERAAGPVDDGACPIPGFLRGNATSCPVISGPGPGVTVQRSKADMFVRRLLRISDAPKSLSDRGTYRSFQRSMTISAIRCTLTYVIFPIVLPGISFLKGVGPIVGIFIGTFALACDTLTIRRFFAVDHKYRWYFSTIAFSIMCLLMVLLVQDMSHVVSSLIS